MRMVGFGVVLALALTACGKAAPDAPAPKPTSKQVTVPPVIKGGWTTVFADANASIDLFGRLGLRPGAYRPVGARYEATAVPTPMSDPSEKPVDVANFTATGDATQLASVRFSLDLVSKNDSFSKTQFATWLGQALRQLGAAGADVVLPAIAAETSRSGTVSGATYVVTRTTIAGGRRLAVTFSRPAGNPGPSQPRK